MKSLKKIIVFLLVLSSIFVTVFTGCGEKKEEKLEVKYNMQYDITEKTEAFYCGTNDVFAVSIDGEVLTAKEDYIVRNNYILFGENIYSALGKGSHSVKLITKGDSLSFTLNITDNKDLDYAMPEIPEVVFVGSKLPKVSFSNDIQSREVEYSLKINGENVDLVNVDANYNRINSISVGHCFYNIKITRNGKEVESKTYTFTTTNDVTKVSNNGIFYGEKALSVSYVKDSKNDNTPCLKLERTSWDSAGLVFDNEFITTCIANGLNKITCEYRLDYVHKNVSSSSQSVFAPQVYNYVDDTSVKIKGNTFKTATVSNDYMVGTMTFDKDFTIGENSYFCIGSLNYTAVFYVKSIVFSKGA